MLGDKVQTGEEVDAQGWYMNKTKTIKSETEASVLDSTFAQIFASGKFADHKDPIFESRVETRFCLENTTAVKIARDLAARHGLPEKIWPDPWVQNIYLDTNEQSLPLGIGVRARRNLIEESYPQMDDQTYHMEFSLSGFGQKLKRRIDTTINKTLGELDWMPFIRLSLFRPYVANRYLRTAFQDDTLRITLDNRIAGFSIAENGIVSRLQLPDCSVIEVKHFPGDQRAVPIKAALKEAGAVPAPGKHYKLYNKRVWEALNQISKMQQTQNQFPGIEYEMKFEVVDDKPFLEFTNMLLSGRIRTLYPYPSLIEPLTYETYNEYRRMDGRIARVAYNGSLLPRVVAKDRGHFVQHGILRREESEKRIQTHAEHLEVNAAPIIASTKRIKKYLEVKSTETDNCYSIAVDLSKTENGRALYQIEIEYRRSEGRRIAERWMLDEIDNIGKIFRSLQGVKKSRLRKEDWIRH